MRDLIDRLRKKKIHISLENENLKLKYDDQEIPSSILEEIRNNKEQIILFLKDNIKSNNIYTPILQAPESESYPLTASQYRFWILSQLEGGSLAYNMPAVVRLTGDVDIIKFEESFRLLIHRHEILRTYFKTNEESEVQQYVLPTKDANFRINKEDYSSVENKNEEIAHYLQEKNSVPFDLEQAPLVRASLIKLGEKEYVFFLSLHHIIADGWSIELLISELIKTYNALIQGKGADLPELNIQYKDYAVWLNSALQQQKQQASEQYWLEQFKGELPILDLPSFRTRPLVQTYNGNSVTHQFTKGFLKKLKTFSKEQDITLFMTLMAGINALLYKYTGQNDIIIGTPIAGREHPDLENQLGLYLNTLAIRTQFKESYRFLDLVSVQKEALLGAYEHQSYPFDTLVDKLNLKRDISRSALFDVIIDLKNLSQIHDIDAEELIGLEVSSYEFKNKVSKVDINFTFLEAEELGLSIDYNPDIYDAYLIERIFVHFENLLVQSLEQPETLLQELNCLTQEEKNQLLFDFNDTVVDYPKDKTIVDLFEEQAEKTPNNVAIVLGKVKLTYQELNEKANQLAHCLKEVYAIEKGNHVGVQLNKNEWAIIAILGILKAGGVYVPIDPELPSKRKVFISDDAQLKLLITETSYVLDLDFYEGNIFAVDVEFEPSNFSSKLLELSINSRDLAYIIYTSGSTGQPKGVMVEHDSLMNYLYWAKSHYLEEGLLNTNFGLFTSLSFDLTVTTLFLPLISGGSLKLFNPSEGISTVLKEYFESEISCVKLTPSHISILDGLDIKASNIEIAIIGGEELRQSQVNILKKLNPSIRIYNEYGPTETTVGCSIYEVKSTEEVILIGSPISNTSILILDEFKGLQLQGVSGEIYIGGRGVARGYLNNPELTAEKFISNPFIEGGRLYRTGDLGRWLPDGNIEFLGRKDLQIKIRGYRIELGEIENFILQYSEDLNQVVVETKEVNQEKVLVAYLVSATNINKSMLRSFLQEKLPEYMIPSFYVELETFALTSNGKIDRRALPSVSEEDIIKNEYVAPRNEIEEKLVAIWQEVLMVEKLGITDNFFELGGHSLIMVQVINRIHRQLGKTVSINTFFANPTIEALSGQLQEDEYIVIPNAPELNSYPLTTSQRRLWLSSLSEGGSLAYNVPTSVKLTGRIDVSRFEEAFKLLIDRHEILRTYFKTNDQGEVRQHIVGSELFSFKIDEQDFRNETDQNGSVLKYLESINRKPFDLEQAPLLRASMICLNDTTHVFSLSMHHIIGDGWSMELMISEIVQMYNSLVQGKLIELPELRIQYKDYAVWLNDEAVKEKQQVSEQYWLDHFKGELPILDLPSFKARPLVQTYNGDRCSYEFSKIFLEKIQHFSKTQNVTMFMTLMAGVKILLHKYSNQTDIIVGTSIAGREHPELENQIGLFLNTLAIRTVIEKNDSFTDLLKKEKDSLLGAYEHQGYSFDELIGKLQLKRDRSRSVLFDFTIVLQNHEQLNNLNNGDSLQDLKVEEYGVELKTSKFDIEFTFVETKQGLSLNIGYNTDIYDSRQIKKMFAHLENIFMQVLDQPKILIQEIPYLSHEEKKELLIDFNDTYVDYPKDKTIIDLFEEQVERTPDNVAVVFENRKITYKELDALSTELSKSLRKDYGIQKGDIVGVQLNRSEWCIISILGILKSGAVYIPIDSELPTNRKVFIVEDTALKLLITETSFIFELDFYQGDVLSIDVEFEPSAYQELIINKVDLRSDDLAYIIYTSGSTGEPKGVMIEHLGVVNTILAQIDLFNLSEFKNSLQFSSFSFDASVWEIFITILSGSSLYIIDDTIRKDVKLFEKYIVENNIEIATLPPAYLKLLDINSLKGLKILITAGEPPIYDKVLEYLKYGTFYNAYGPTEASICGTIYEIEKGSKLDSSVIPIGKPIANASIYIVDEFNNIQAAGVTGEICIGGPGLARGYLNKPELTKEKFIQNPFKAGDRLYKTGDLGRWLSDGTIEYLGRIDDQVKIRGHRIELGEIESSLSQYSDLIKQILVLVKEVNREKVIVAYYVSEKEIDKSELRRYLVKTLPEYMVPGFYVGLESMPLTTNGKIDRKALPSITGEDLIKKQYEAPRNEIEEKLVAIWQEVLAIDTIGISDNFFELGGHSLLAIQVFNRMKLELGKNVAFPVFFENPTIKDLCSYLEDSEYTAIPKTLGLNSYPLTTSQRRFWLLSQLKGASSVYNMLTSVKLTGNIDVSRFEEAFKLLINRHEILRTYFKTNEEGEIYQYVIDYESFIFKIDEQDFRNETDQHGSILKYLENTNSKPFDLEQAPLLRATMICLNDSTHVFSLSMHHIIGDGWSMELMISEIVQIYNSLVQGKLIELPELAIQYKDYAVWLNGETSKEKQKVSEQYWLDQFKGELPILDLPSFKTRPLVQTYNGDRCSYEFSKIFLEKIQHFSKAEDVTMFMTLMAGVKIVLHKYSNQTDIIVGTPIAGRDHPDLENQVGAFLNTLAIRTVIENNDSFRDLLKKEKDTLLGAYEHQGYSFDELVGKLQLKQDRSRSVLFDVLIVLQNHEQLNNLNNGNALQDLTVERYGVELKTSKVDIEFTFVETKEGLTLDIGYNTDIYDACQIKKMLVHLENVFIQVLDEPKILIQEIDYVSEQEKEELLISFNNTTCSYSNDKTIIELFEEQVDKSPNAIAVVFEDKELTYRELNEQANQLAVYLREKYSIKPNDLIGIKLERSERLIVSIFGILKSGAAYMPIDPGYPQERIRYIENDSKSKTIIDETEFELFFSQKEQYRSVNSYKINVPSDLAYVIYTSGTTGNPKGVMIEHTALVNRLEWMQKAYELTDNDVILQKTSYSFDVSVWELFWWSFTGTKLCVLKPEGQKNPKEIINYIEKYEVSVLHFVPSMLNVFLDYLNEDKSEIQKLKSLKRIFVSGEALSVDLNNNFFVVLPHVSLVNLYGPTEATIDVSFFECSENLKLVPIGKSIDNTKLYILDKSKQIIPIGVSGEIYIGGSGLARGYLYRADLTSEKFIAHPFIDGQRLYKTGDIGRWLPDGNIEYLGRIDDQVKIRGHRIELGEIESNLFQFSDLIKQNLVLVKEVNGEKALVAYYISEADIDKSELRSYLVKKLPEYMVPVFYIGLDSMPLTSNGKIDRKALPGITGEDLIKKEYVAPRNEIEEKLIRVVASILDCKESEIGINDNFFDLGINSLSLIKIVSLVKMELKTDVTISMLFEFSNVSQLSDKIFNLISTHENDLFENNESYVDLSQETEDFLEQIID